MSLEVPGQFRKKSHPIGPDLMTLLFLGRLSQVLKGESGPYKAAIRMMFSAGGDLSYCKHVEPKSRVSQNVSHFRLTTLHLQFDRSDYCAIASVKVMRIPCLGRRMTMGRASIVWSGISWNSYLLSRTLRIMRICSIA